MELSNLCGQLSIYSAIYLFVTKAEEIYMKRKIIGENLLIPPFILFSNTFFDA